MKVSIIVPVYNGEKTIERAIDSCTNQSYKNIEILVINNKSTDKTVEIVNKLKSKDSRISLFQSDIKGRSIARNIGLSNATGEFIQFLDADDELYLKKIELGVKTIQKKNYFAHVCSVIYYNEISEKSFIYKVTNVSYNDLLYQNFFPINSPLFKNRKSIFFEEGLEFNEDWLFWIQLFEDEQIYFQPDIIGGKVNITGNNTMSNKETMTQYEMYVRQKVKNKRVGYSYSYFIKELKSFLIYQLVPKKDMIIKEFIKKNSFFMYVFSKFLLRIPLTKKIILKKISKALDKNEILY